MSPLPAVASTATSATTTALASKAVRTENVSVSTGSEWHLGILTTGCANGVEHLTVSTRPSAAAATSAVMSTCGAAAASTTAAAAAAAAGLTGLAAGLTALGVVVKAFRGMKFLF